MRFFAVMEAGGEGTQLHAPSLADGTTLGGYVIRECIGIGGFGEVYRARHAMIGREVAIKVLHRRYSHDADAIARFVAEARAVNKVSHPGIVEIHDFGTVEGRQYCVMELVVGETLRDRLRKKPKLTLDEALPILQGVADALDAAHSAGVAHRDIKPDNIFITKDGVKLIDFGLAKLTRGDDAVPVTQTGAVFGTPLYMSPEQCRGKKIDLRTDQYSFGVVAYQMLVGETPFSGDALELALHHLNDPPKSPGIDERVDRVLLALLAKDPQERPASAREAIDALVGAAPLPTVRKLRRPTRVGVPAIAAIVLAVVGSTAWVFLHSASKERQVATPDCASGASRLVGIWDMPMRARIAARFSTVQRADVTATWKLIDSELNSFAARWEKDWNEACRSEDQKREPLLYAQRLACLDNAVLVLRGAVEQLPDADPSDVAIAFPGTSARRGRLDECESEDVLRAQVPAPPPETRAAVSAALIDFLRLEVQRRSITDVGRHDDVDALLAKYDALVKRLDALHSPAVAEVAHYRALFLFGAARFDDARRSPARAALSDALVLARHYRNDVWLGRDYVMQIEEEIEFNGLEGAITDAIAGGEAALAHAGAPAWLAIELATQHARADLFHGRLSDAATHLRTTLSTFPRAAFPPALDHNSPRTQLGLALTAMAQPEAVAVYREEVAAVVRTLGPIHYRTAIARENFAGILIQAGDLTAAESELDQATAILAEVDTPALTFRRQGVLIDQLDLELGLRSDQVESTFARLRAVRADLTDAAEYAHDTGRLAALSYLLDHAQLAPEIHADLASDLAFMRDPAHAPPPARPGAVAYALAIRGDSKGALAKLAEAAPATSWQRAEVAAARGLAMLGAGDTNAAIASLGESQYVMDACCLSPHYFEPTVAFALARALASSDRQQARLYANDAVRGFARWGRDADRRAAEAWLEANP